MVYKQFVYGNILNIMNNRYLRYNNSYALKDKALSINIIINTLIYRFQLIVIVKFVLDKNNNNFKRVITPISVKC